MKKVKIIREKTGEEYEAKGYSKEHTKTLGNYNHF